MVCCLKSSAVGGSSPGLAGVEEEGSWYAGAQIVGILLSEDADFPRSQMGSSSTIKVGVIGYGYWGPNIVRNLLSHPDISVAVVADQRKQRLLALKKTYPSIATVSEGKDVIAAKGIDAIAIATPVNSHYSLVRAALAAGKHVLVEKPLAASLHDAESLVAYAQKKSLVVMVDHTYIYSGAIETMKKLVDSGEIGLLQSFTSMRFNLGLFQSDINVIWDLAAHDLSILLYLVEKEPALVNATGISHTENGLENIAYITMRYKDGMIAHVGVSWVSPVKIRQILVSGDRKMIAYDDTQASEKVKVYDAGYSVRTDVEKQRLYMDYRSGDILVPKVRTTEALEGVIEDFVRAMSSGVRPRSDAEFGLKVVRTLDAAERSLRKGGGEILLS
jgi:predicted dehydrogenase